MFPAGWTIMAVSGDQEEIVAHALSMTSAGWTIMAVSVLSVLALVTFCLYRVLTLPPVDVTDHLKAPLDIDTQDTIDAD